MSTIVPIARERVEIGRVVGNGDREWMMLVLDGDETIDAGFYLTRNAATKAAETWKMPIRYVHEVGTVIVEKPAPPPPMNRVRYRAGRPSPARRSDREKSR